MSNLKNIGAEKQRKPTRKHVKDSNSKMSKVNNNTAKDGSLHTSRTTKLVFGDSHSAPDDCCSQKHTYSAQHATPNLTTTNMPNAVPTNIHNCNTAPLYDVSSRMINNGYIPRGYTTPINLQNSCPCGSLPPPMPPGTHKDDLWDLQFCRWWGWNWIRKREEMMNQKQAEMNKTRSLNSEKKRSKSRKPQKHRRKDDFFSWCNKLFKGNQKKKDLNIEEKKQLQDLYDTPCSSVTFNNNCVCPLDDWDCRSLNLEGQYEVCCSSARQTSRSTVVVHNKTRRQSCKRNTRRHKSWVCEKTESSSSDECCQYVSVCPKCQSSTDESVEYLSMRMACIKSDCEDNSPCCPCMKLKNCPRTVCCPCKLEKTHETSNCSPCVIKLIREKQPNCPCNTLPKQKHTNVRLHCSNKPEKRYRRHRSIAKSSPCRSPSPCKSMPICRPGPHKIPRFCRHTSPCKYTQDCTDVVKSIPECKRRPKRKNLMECTCQKPKEYILCCSCQHPPQKKIKKVEKPKQVCCCCCCCCCCCKNKMTGQKQCEYVGNTKKDTKPEEILKHTSDKSVNCCYINPTNNNLNQENRCTNGLNMISNCSPMEENIIANTMRYSVSTALEKNLYKSPFTGKVYPLSTKWFTANTVLQHNNLPNPISIEDKIRNLQPVQSPLVDEEHNILLSAVCDAIMASRFARRETRTLPVPESLFSYHNDYWADINPFVARTTKPIHEYEFLHKSPSPNLSFQSSEEIGIHNYYNDNTQDMMSFNDTEDYNYQCGNDITVNNPIPPSISITTGDNITMSSFLAPNADKSENVASRNSPIQKIEKYASFKTPSSIGRRTRIPVRKGKHTPTMHFKPKKQYLVKPENSTVSKIANQGNIQKELPMQVETNFWQQERFFENPNSIGDEIEGLYTRSNHENSNNKPVYLLDSLITQKPCIQESGLTTDNSVFEKLYADYENYIAKSNSSQRKNNAEMYINVPINLQEYRVDLSQPFIPFNSPRNWVNTPQLPGVSLTGLFSTAGLISNNSKERADNNNGNKNTKVDMRQFKKEKFYNVLFASDRPDYCEDFPNLPCHFRPVPPPRCVINHNPGYPPIVFKALPVSDITEGTQTVRFSGTVQKQESEEELRSMSLKKESQLSTTTKEIQTNKYPQTILREQSEKELCCLNLKKDDFNLPRVGTSKGTATSDFVNKNTPRHSREIGCQYIKETSVKSPNSEKGTQDFENTCLFLEHEPKNYRLIANNNIVEDNHSAVSKSAKLEKGTRDLQNFRLAARNNFVEDNHSENLLSIINRPSERNNKYLQSNTNNFQSFDSVSKEYRDSSLLPATEPYQNNVTSPAFIKHSQAQTQNVLTVHTTTSPFKIKYTKVRSRDRSVPKTNTQRKVMRKESPFSMFIKPVMSVNTATSPFADASRESVSRPERKVVVKKPDKLKMREKLWRY